MDLIEMIMAKADMRIASLYDEVLVDDAAEKQLGIELRGKFGQTLKVGGEGGRGRGGGLG